MELPSLVHPSLSHQEMEVRVEIDPLPKGLNGRDDPGHNVSPGHESEITSQ